MTTPLRVAISACILIALQAPAGSWQQVSAAEEQPRKVRSVILMIGDGMGLAQITLARIQKGRLWLEDSEHFGFSYTQSLDKFVTDSSASATALASGYLIKNGEVGQLPDGRKVRTILEYAEERGLWTGLVATSRITHATPASMATHVKDRNLEFEIARQLALQDIEVILGGGWDKFLPQRVETVRSRAVDPPAALSLAALPFSMLPLGLGLAALPAPADPPLITAAGVPYGMRKDGKDLIREMTGRGYRFVRTPAELAAAVLGPPRKLLGLFHSGPMPKVREGRSPSLSGMAHAALSILSQSPNGFFLMVEGSQIDWGGHDNDSEYAMLEAADFDDAVGEVYRFLGRSGLDRETLVVITGDHETGGLALNPNSKLPLGYEPRWSTKEHTGIPVPVFSAGPDSAKFSGIQTHSRIGRKLIESLLGRELEWDASPSGAKGAVDGSTDKAPETATEKN